MEKIAEFFKMQVRRILSDYNRRDDYDLTTAENDIMATMDRYHSKKLKEELIEFADWLTKLSPSEKVSVWSKDGQYKGLFTMDNEQLLDKFKRYKSKLQED